MRAALSFAALFIAVQAVSAPATTIALEGFETGDATWPGGRGDKGGLGSSAVTSDQAHSGTRSLAYAYEFAGTTGTPFMYARLFPNILLPGTPASMALWVKGDGSGRRLSVRYVDAAGEIWQRVLGTLDFEEWRQMSFPVTDQGTHHFGGPEGSTRHKLDYPVRWSELIIDKTIDDAGSGVIFIDDVALETAIASREAVHLSIQQPGPLEVTGPGPHLLQAKIVVRNWSAKTQEGNIAWRVRDYRGVRVAVGASELSVGSGQTAQVPLDIRLPGQGYYELSASFRMKSRTVREEAVLAAVRPSPLKALDPDSHIGVNGHLANSREMAMMQEAGIKWMRADWLWGVCQPQEGAFNWEVLDSRYDAAREHGITLLPILCYGVDWASTKPVGADGGATRYMPRLDAWLGYVRAVVERYREGIKFWEVWNEPNIGFWLSSDEEYVTLLKETAKAIRAIDPEATVLMGGTAGSPQGYIRMLYEAGCKEYMDVINIHPYQYPRMPDDGMARQVEGIREVMAEFGDADKPIWATEVGYPNHVGSSGVDLRTQADYLARTYLELLAAGVDKVVWYDYQNGTDRTYNEDNFGIVFVGDRPKPCYFAMQTLSETVGDAAFVSRPPMPEGLSACLFRKPDGRHVMALWALEGDRQVQLQDVRRIEVRDLSGNAVPLTASPNQPLSVDTSPVFITGQRLPKISSTATLTVEPATGATMPTTAYPVRVTLTNPSASRVEGVLSVSVPDGWTLLTYDRAVTVPAGGAAQVELEAAASPTTAYGDYAFRVALNGHAGRTRVHLERIAEVSLKAPWDIRFASGVEAGKPFITATVTNLLNRPIRANAWWAAPLCPPALTGMGGRGKTFSPGRPLVIRARDSYAEGASEPPYLPTVLRIDTNDVPLFTSTQFFACGQALRATPETLAAPLVEGSPGVFPLRYEEQVQQIEDWRGEEDLSALFRTLWTPEELILTVRVRDDSFSQEKTGGAMWMGDSVQFAVDPSCSRDPKAPYSEYDVALTPDGPQVFRRMSPDGTDGGATNASAKITAEGELVSYEIRVPWSELGIEAQPGKAIGFSLVVNDDDGGGRRGWMEWGGGIGWTKDPGKYLDITLAR